jgi:hypothetical protein
VWLSCSSDGGAKRHAREAERRAAVEERGMKGELGFWLGSGLTAEVLDGIRANSGGLGGLQLRTPRVKENGINVCFGLGLGRGRFFLCSDISVQGLL